MDNLKKIEIEVISGAWIVRVDDQKPQAYTQHPAVKDHIRLAKDLLKALELQNVLEIKER